MCDSSRSWRTATKAEVVIVFVAVSAFIAFSYFTARHAAANTTGDPAFRELVKPESTKLLFKAEYLYVPLLFQFIAWLALGASLLPTRIQESWLLAVHRWRRGHLYFTLALCLLVSAGIYSHASSALRAASIPALIDQRGSTSGPNNPPR